MVFGFALQGICAGWSSSSRIERGRGNNPYNMTSWVEYLPSGSGGGCCFCFICQKLHMRTSTFCMFSFNLKHFLSLNYKIHMETNIPYIHIQYVCMCVHQLCMWGLGGCLAGVMCLAYLLSDQMSQLLLVLSLPACGFNWVRSRFGPREAVAKKKKR